MKKLLLITYVAASTFSTAFANQFVLDIKTGVQEKSDIAPTPKHTFEYFENRILVTYEFDKVLMSDDDLFENAFSFRYADFGVNEIDGQPAYIFQSDFYNMPDNQSGSVELISYEYTDLDFEMAPARFPRPSNSGISYTVDNVAPISTSDFFPENIVADAGTSVYRGHASHGVTINPLQYSNSAKTVRAYTKITYAINFTKSEDEYTIANIASDDNIFNNSNTYDDGIMLFGGDDYAYANKVERDYLVITNKDLESAANRIAEWKRKLGYKTFVKTAESWTLESAKAAIQECYEENPNLYYLLIIGDERIVPSQYFTTKDIYAYDPNDKSRKTYFYSDFYYSCLDGENDMTPDIYYGRFPAKDLTDAQTMVEKTIAYEKEPLDSKSYREKAIFSTSYEDDNGMADMRYTETVENILQLYKDKFSETQRIYYAHEDVNPLKYRYGDSIPAELRRPNFAWDGNCIDLYNSVNEGCSMILHMNHGNTEGWLYPWFRNEQIGHMKNKDMYPVMFDLECLLGSFEKHDECMTNRLLNWTNGGMAAVISASIETFDIENGVIAKKIFNALWPDIIHSEEEKQPIATLGELLNVGLGSIQGWKSSTFHKRAYHCFGDPSITLYWKKHETLRQRLSLVASAKDGLHITVTDPDFDMKSRFGVYVSIYNTFTEETQRYFASSFDLDSYNPKFHNVIISCPGFRSFEIPATAVKLPDIEIGTPNYVEKCSYNPANSNIEFSFGASPMYGQTIKFQVRDQSGNIVREASPKDNAISFSINISDQLPGIYIVCQLSGNEIEYTKQIIKTN